MVRAGLILVLASGVASAQAFSDKVDELRVQKAIDSGVAYLKTLKSEPFNDTEFWGVRNSDPLVLYTLSVAGVPESDPKMQELLPDLLTCSLAKIYESATIALALEEIDRVKYQRRIAECIQGIVDGMKSSGSFGYEHPPVKMSDAVPTEAARDDIASAGGTVKPKVLDFAASSPVLKVKPTPKQKIMIVKQHPDGCGVPETNSTAQYAILGLRAGHESGVFATKDVLTKAREWWVKCQHPAKPEDPPVAIFKEALGWDGNAVATGGKKTGQTVAGMRPIMASPRGWCYNEGPGSCPDGGPAFGSMTAGALSSLIMLDAMLGMDWKQDSSVIEGMAWMASKFSVTDNPPGIVERNEGHPNAHHYYYLYALERVGMLFTTKFMGDHDWYAEGANYLLDHQKGGGQWAESYVKTAAPVATWDTCFAILFLKRGTRPMVASGAWGDR